MIDGIRLPEALLLLEVLNIPIAGPGLRLASAEFGDGALDVAFLRSERRDEVVAALAADAPLPLEVVRGRRVEITWSEGSLRVDDSFQAPPDGPLKLTASIGDRQIRILVPACA